MPPPGPVKISHRKRWPPKAVAYDFMFLGPSLTRVLDPLLMGQSYTSQSTKYITEKIPNCYKKYVQSCVYNFYSIDLENVSRFSESYRYSKKF